MSLHFVSESSGATIADDLSIVIMFEPGGVVDLFREDHTSPTARGGTYTFDGQTLALAFTAADFHPDVQVALDLSKPTVTLSPLAGRSAGPRRRLRQRHGELSSTICARI